MTRPDLTRWNRAGLRRLVTVDGNAAVFLEILRGELRRRFGERWSSLPADAGAPPADELESAELSEQRENQRLLAQYQDAPADKRELGWELSRALVRSCHVLAEHVNAHANEAFLRTATQWESVRRIVELIDYHPAAATSALTELIVLAKPGKSGTLPLGFQVKHTRVDGGPQIIFETLEEIEAHAELNELRPKGWDASDAASASGAPPPPPPPPLTPLALERVRVLEGVGAARGAALDRLAPSGTFLVKDLVELDPTAPLLGVPETWLRELKIKAVIVATFALEPGWDAVEALTLPEIAAYDPAALAELSGKDEGAVKSLLQRVELLGACLDQPVYARTRLAALVLRPPQPVGVETAWFTPQKPKVQTGQIAMVFQRSEQRGEAVRIASVDAATQRIRLMPSPLEYAWWAWPLKDSRLRVVPRWHRKAWLNGKNVVRTREPHGLTRGAFVAWRDKDVWSFAEVSEADERNLRLRTTSRLPTATTELYEARALAGPQLPPDLELGLVGAPMPKDGTRKVKLSVKTEPVGATDFRAPDAISAPGAPPGMPSGALSIGSFLFPSPFLPMDLVKAAVELLLSMGVMVIPSTGKPVFKFLPDVDSAITKLLKMIPEELWVVANLTPVEKRAKLAALLATKPEATESILFEEFTTVLEQAIQAHGPLLGLSKQAPAKAVVVASNPRYVFEGTPDKLEAGEWIVAELSTGLRALTIAEIDSLGGRGAPERFALAFQAFSGSVGELLAVHADFRGELEPSGSRLNQAPVEPDRIELSPLPASLKRGRKLLLTAPGKAPAQVRVVDIDPNGIRIEPPQAGFRKSELVIRGNVVAAGHGAAKPAKQLSSGTASLQKSLLLEVVDVATVPDATFPTGSRADLEVLIGNVRWQQVGRFDRSGSTDVHYVVRATEEGFLRLEFGDGIRGRRLPSGSNNVRVSFRVGAGRAGNVKAGSLTKPVQPHWLVQSIEQPRDAIGGEELESVTNMRERAPGTLLALERSVSIGDFENLAASRADVWQARAFFHPGGLGRLDLVRVVVVPAGGGDIEGPLRSELERFLSEHAIPTTAVRIDGFSRKRIQLDVTIRVDEERFDATEAAERVRAALGARLDIERRGIAQPLYLAEIYEIVEGTEGVSDSHCAFRGTSAPRISPDREDQVVYLDLAGDPDDLRLQVERYEP